jgi:hypothetical protein
MPNMPAVSVDLEEAIGSADENEGHRCYGLTRPVFHVSRIQRLLARVERFSPRGFAVRDPDITAPSKLDSSENSQNREALREVRRWIFVTLGE